MKKLPLKDLQKRIHELPQNEVFFVYDNTRNPTIWFLSLCINGHPYVSEAWREDESEWKRELDKAMKQIMTIKLTGWFATGEKRYDDMNLHKLPLFRCAYCQSETVEPKGKCVCRTFGGEKIESRRIYVPS